MPKLDTFRLDNIAFRCQKRAELRQVIGVGRQGMVAKSLFVADMLEKVFGRGVHAGEFMALWAWLSAKKQQKKQQT